MGEMVLFGGPGPEKVTTSDISWAFVKNEEML